MKSPESFGNGEEPLSGAMDICVGGCGDGCGGGGGVEGVDDDEYDDDNNLENGFCVVFGVPGHIPCASRCDSVRIGGFLGGAPTTRNMSHTRVLSGNSFTGWYLWVFLLSRSLWMSVSIFLTKSFPWCLTKVAYFTDVDDELDDAGADMEGPEPQALPEADDENDDIDGNVVVCVEGVDGVSLAGAGRSDNGLPDIMFFDPLSFYPLFVLFFSIRLCSVMFCYVLLCSRFSFLVSSSLF